MFRGRERGQVPVPHVSKVLAPVSLLRAVRCAKVSGSHLVRVQKSRDAPRRDGLTTSPLTPGPIFSERDQSLAKVFRTKLIHPARVENRPHVRQQERPCIIVRWFANARERQRSAPGPLRPGTSSCVRDRKQRPPAIGRTVVKLLGHFWIRVPQFVCVVDRPPQRLTPKRLEVAVNLIHTEAFDGLGREPSPHPNLNAAVRESATQVANQSHRHGCPRAPRPHFERILVRPDHARRDLSVHRPHDALELCPLVTP